MQNTHAATHNQYDLVVEEVKYGEQYGIYFWKIETLLPLCSEYNTVLDFNDLQCTCTGFVLFLGL